MLKIKRIFFFSLLPLFIVMLYGCTSTKDAPSIYSYENTDTFVKPIFGTVMDKSIAYEGIYRNPVIFIHGFLGSRLTSKVNGANVWGDFSGVEALSGASSTELRELSFPMKYGTPLREIQDNDNVSGMLTDVEMSVLGVHFKTVAYSKILNIFSNAGFVFEGKPLPEGKNYYSLFAFHYDWRQDIVVNAARFHEFVLKKRAYMQKEYKKVFGIDNYDVQFDLAAHSMGGLLARYYLRFGNQELPTDGSMPIFDWRGSKNIDKVIIIGTPNAGYLDTCLEMINGLRISPTAEIYPPAVAGTFATYYQMMPLLYTRSVLYKDDPNGPPVDIFDPNVWIKMKWGLADPEQDSILKIILPDVDTKKERRTIAIDHLSKCLKNAKQFTDALSLYKKPPEDVLFFLFFGNALETRRTAMVDRKTGDINVTGYDTGDGVVTVGSALMDAREGRKWEPFFISPIPWTSVTPLMTAHMGLTEVETFDNDLSYILLTYTLLHVSDKKKRDILTEYGID